VVVKLPRTPEASAGLRNEARTLDAIHRGAAGHPAGAPRILFTREIEGAGHAVAETARPGTPLWRHASRAGYRPLALRVTTWLTAFTRATEPAAGDAAARPTLTARLDRFEDFYGPVLDRALAADARALVAAVEPLPRVCEHRDLGPWNIVLGVDGSLGILDWESSELFGFPGPDLVYFLAYHAFFRDGAMRSKRFLRSYRAALDPRTETGRVRDDCLRSFLDAHAIAEPLLGPIATLTWLLHADSDAHRIRADAAGTPTATTLRDSLFLRLWQIEADRALRGA
jgi:aminoglycoside phosphotransferase (APT) family kinase protein